MNISSCGGRGVGRQVQRSKGSLSRIFASTGGSLTPSRPWAGLRLVLLESIINCTILNLVSLTHGTNGDNHSASMKGDCHGGQIS